MRKFKLVTADYKILYEGYHHSLSQTIEHAITHDIGLDGINLEGKDLRHINLDGVKLQNANFSRCNLSGANMSESQFKNCDFSHTNLTDTCLCYSDLHQCNLKYATFKETDISMASLVLCGFEGISALNLDYQKAFKLEHLVYTHYKNPIWFSSPPLLITLENKQIIIMGKVMFYNENLHTLGDKPISKSIITLPPFDIQSIVVI